MLVLAQNGVIKKTLEQYSRTGLARMLMITIREDDEVIEVLHDQLVTTNHYCLTATACNSLSKSAVAKCYGTCNTGA